MTKIILKRRPHHPQERKPHSLLFFLLLIHYSLGSLTGTFALSPIRKRLVIDVSSKDDDRDTTGNSFRLSLKGNEQLIRQNTAVTSKEESFDLLPTVRGGGDEGTLSLAALLKFADKNFWLIGMTIAVWVAQRFPELGVDGGVFRPELFVGKYGVTFIFLLSGLSLELSELREAATHHELNLAVQTVSFLVWPFLFGLPFARIMEKFDFLPKPLVDGVLVMMTLPTTVNMCVLLTATAGGNVASSLCNAVLGNVMGILATPALLLRFFGTTVSLPFGKMVTKLSSKVLLPVVVGQLMRTTPALGVYKTYSKLFKRLQETILLGIVWNAFSNAFSKGVGFDVPTTVRLVLVLAVVHLAALFGLFNLFKTPRVQNALKLERGDVVAAAFCASQKTLAFGLPLIKTVFDGNPNLASYCAPIMFIHPLQLILGSLAVPEFSRYTSS